MAEDKRIRYTKLFLKESLIKKLEEKPISRISITELCKDAEINRATYYAHYIDQYDQLKQIEQDLMIDIASRFEIPIEAGNDKQLTALTAGIIEYIRENARLCRVLLGKNGNIDFQENFASFLGEKVFGMWSMWSNNHNLDSTTVNDLYCFIVTGSIGILRKWLFDDHDNRTPAQLAQLIVKITNNGIKVFL